MAIFRTGDSSNDHSSSLRLPASKRISASERLSTIIEGDKTGNMPAKMPLRSSMKQSVASGDRGVIAGGAPPYETHPAFRSADTLRSGPPAYGQIPAPSVGDSEDLTAPVEGEKLARLRREGPQRKTRGGIWRLLLIVLIILAIIGLAVGLGVGLTVGRRGNGNTDQTTSSGPSSSSGTQDTPPQFPLGEYSFVTALRTQQTSCSARAAAWRCYPYSTFAESNTSSLATFNWIITNTSASYALNTTGATSSAGIPANLTISTQNNPFAIAFTNQSLTYINDNTNSSSPRYSFSFTMTKIVVPSPAITSNNQASQCFFNSTTFAGYLYLNAGRSFPDTQLQSSTSVGGYTQWPYAVEITQSSPGGSGVPDCYEMVNGGTDDRIVNGLDPQPVSSTCLCDYRNY